MKLLLHLLDKSLLVVSHVYQDPQLQPNSVSRPALQVKHKSPPGFAGAVSTRPKADLSLPIAVPVLREVDKRERNATKKNGNTLGSRSTVPDCLAICDVTRDVDFSAKHRRARVSFPSSRFVLQQVKPDRTMKTADAGYLVRRGSQAACLPRFPFVAVSTVYTNSYVPVFFGIADNELVAALTWRQRQRCESARARGRAAAGCHGAAGRRH